MHIVIIGNGISGSTAARWIRKKGDHKITMISSESKFFYSRTALMYIYMGHMRHEDTKPYEDWFWKENRIDLVFDHVDEIDFEKQNLKLKTKGAIHFDKLILALGSKPNKFGWPGQDLIGVSGLYHYQDLENMEQHSKNLKRAVIVGGGLIGIEMAEMFASRNIPVTMLVREKSYWDNVLPKEESQIISKHILHHHIDLRLGVNLGEILSDENGKARAVIIKETGEEINCQYVGLTAGVSPNIAFLKETSLATERGILVDEYLQTNISNVFAIGDCAQLQSPREGRRSIEAVWYTGRMMGETVAYNIEDTTVKYDPGIWFNSAKFLDIEYQVYGNVLAHPPENHEAIVWESKDGDKLIRLVYDGNDKTIIGFNLLGVRYRHEVCEKWIKEGSNIEEVLTNLSLANFDPEFFKQYEAELVEIYNRKTGSNLKLNKKKGLNAVLSFLNLSS